MSEIQYEPEILETTVTPAEPSHSPRPVRMRLPRQLNPLRHRNYRLFFSGQLISVTGTWMQSVAQGWLVYELTHSRMALGIVGMVTALPILAFSLIAGVLADHFSKRNVLIITQSASMLLAFTLAALTYGKVITIYHIAAIGFLIGSANCVDAPTRHSFVIEMVGRKDLAGAIALNSATFNSARIVGPSIAGLIIAAFGAAWAFFLNGVSYIAVIAGLALMRVNHVKQSEPPRIRERLRESFAFIRQQPNVKALLTLTLFVSIFSIPYAVLMPVFASKEVLGVGARGLGYLYSSVGTGALIGALTISSLGDFRAKGKLLLVGNLTFCTMLILFSFSRLMPLSMVLLVFAGWGMMTNMNLTNTLIQTAVPDHLRGRVMSVYTWMFLGMAPIGSLQAGLVAHWFGAPTAVCVGAAICGAVALILSRRLARIPG